jgi:hypothetical protein
MTSVAPPTEFFPGIDFNPSFYNLGQSPVTLDYLNSNFLRSTGYAISRAQFTLFNGTVDINENLDVSGNINASAYLLNGVPFTPSQWTTSVNDIYYTTGNVGIGKTNPSATYKLDVSGNINCNAIFRSGTELTQYTDTNVRTVLSTSVGTGLQWNSSTNRMNVVFPPSPLPYGDTEVRILLSNSAGTNMTWNTGTNRFNVGIATTTSLGVVQVGSGLSITPQGLLSANATSYTLPIATNTTLGGVRVDGSTIVINATTGVISSVQTQSDWNNTDGTSRAFIVNKPTIINSRWSQTGSNIFYNSGNVGIGNSAPFTPLCVGNSSIVGSDGNIIFGRNISGGSRHFKLGIDTDYYFGIGDFGANNTAGTWIEPFKVHFLASNNSLVVSANGNVGIGDIPGTTIKLDVNGNLLIRAYGTTGSGTRGIFFRSDHITTNLQYNCSILTFDHGGTGPTDGLSINGFSGLSFCTGANTRQERMRITSDGNVFIGASTNSSDDGNVNISTPDSTFYVRGPRVAGSTTNISFRGGLEGNGSGRVRLWLTADAAHSSYIESIHVGNGDTNLIFGTSLGNSLPIERMRIRNNGNTNLEGTFTCNGHIQIFFNGNSVKLERPDNWVRVRDGNNTHLDFAAGQLFSHSTITGVDLNVSGSANVSGNIRFQCDRWHTASDGRNKFFLAGNGCTFYSGGMSGGANARMHEYRRTYDDATLGWFENTGLLRSWGYSSLSDSRIKKNIRDIDDVQGLEKILLIQPKKYNYIEKEKNKHDVIGFIAQQIGEVIPEAITKTEGIPPNVYKNCLVNNKREIYYSLPLDIVIDTDVIITDTEDGTGERYKIKEIYDDYFIIDKDIDRDEVFVKGYSINDLHNLDKNYIYTLNVCATQELYKLIMEQREEINNLKNRLSTFRKYQ